MAKELICSIHNDIWKKADKAIKDVPRYFNYRDLNEEELYEMCENMDSYIDDLKYDYFPTYEDFKNKYGNKNTNCTNSPFIFTL